MVGVDHARYDDATGGVEDLDIVGGVEVLAHGEDDAALDEDVGPGQLGAGVVHRR